MQCVHTITIIRATRLQLFVFFVKFFFQTWRKPSEMMILKRAETIETVSFDDVGTGSIREVASGCDDFVSEERGGAGATANAECQGMRDVGPVCRRFAYTESDPKGTTSALCRPCPRPPPPDR